MRDLRTILAAPMLLFTNVISQDTTWVQTFNFSDITKRRDVYEFPNSSQTYAKGSMYKTPSVMLQQHKINIHVASGII
ncbi:MAG: hypothetical protein R2813_08795 [Flavobacteriales bacterium]